MECAEWDVDVDRHGVEGEDEAVTVSFVLAATIRLCKGRRIVDQPAPCDGMQQKKTCKGCKDC